MSVVATVWAPDGTQIRHKRGKPLTFVRPDARRAMLSAVKAWWPTDPIGKKGTGRTWGQPPVGAEIRLDGEPWMRFEEVAVRDASGEIVDVTAIWVDIAQRVRDEVKAAKIAAYKAREEAQRAAARAEAASDTPEIPVLTVPEGELVGGSMVVGDIARPVAAGPAAIEPKSPTRRRG
jgi:hypothetical protein